MPDPPPHNRSPSGAARSGRGPWLLSAAVIVLGATAVRIALNFRHPRAPATDGPYYPMQSWWLLEHGRLMYDDLPLLFWLQAGLGRLLHSVGGGTLSAALERSSRLLDAALQPWTAAAVVALACIWSQGRRAGLLGGSAAATLAVLSPPILRMASDFQKNSLGLLWMALAMLFLRQALSSPRRLPWWGLLGGVILLQAMTHVGAFGVTAVMVGAGLLGAVGAADAWRPTRARLLLFLALGVAAAGSIGLLALLEPTRAQSLLNAPWRLFSGRVDPVGAGATALALLIVIPSLMRAHRDRRAISSGDAAVVIGAAAGLLLLTLPCLESEYSRRFLLMAPVPASILLAFLVSRQALDGGPRWPARALAVVAAALIVPALAMPMPPTISDDAATEIAALETFIPAPSRTLVVAPHGVQWWAGHLLHTPVRRDTAPLDAFERYDRVLLLQPRVGRGAAPGPGKPLIGSPAGPRRAPGDRGGAHGRTLTLPAGATIRYRGDHLTLYELPRPVVESGDPPSTDG